MITCIRCGTKVQRYHTALYCYECLGMLQKQYSKNYRQEKILKLFAKEKGRCLFCSKKPIDIHHRNLNRHDNRKYNLIPLCSRCHKILHSRVLPKKKHA